MSDQKISQLTAGTPADTDIVPYVDLATNTTKKALKSELKGEKGDTGDNATVDVGTTTTGNAGTDASVVNSGTTSDAVFDFTIPRGDKGEKGDDGAPGAAGADGADGLDITWLGAYVAETAYAINDAVSYSGSSYICTAPSTGNLPTDTDYWDLMAQKGSAGTGTGDVLGPATNSADYIPQWDGADSKTLKNGLAVPAGGLAGLTALGDYVAKATYDAQTILHATSDNTPVALTVGEQTVVGRATGGNIAALTIDSDLSSVSANDDTIPSAKATKAMGDAKLALAGGTMTGNITLGENTAIALDPAGSADEKWSGITCTGTAGATVAVGDLLYLDATAGEWLLADADAASSSGDVPLAICILAAGDGEATNLLLQGTIRSAAFPASIALGAPVYVSTTAGDIQAAQPTGTDDVIRRVGWAITAEPNTIYFNPSNDFIVHT
jgi:hypothetical protein